LALAAKLALGDFCWQVGSFSMNLLQVGTRLQVTTRASNPWVGFGVPKNPSYTRMNLGNYVVGGGGRVYDMITTRDRNVGPDMAGTYDYVHGTESTSTVGGITTLSFEREMSPIGNGALPIDPSRPFNILWAFGPMSSGVGWSSIGYHAGHAGAFKVDFRSSGNCDAATLAALQAAAPKGKKGTPKKAPPKKAGKQGTVVCAVGQTACTASLQAQGLNCIVGTCVTTSTAIPVTPVCSTGQSLCTGSLSNLYNCIPGQCFYMPATTNAVCADGQIICTAGLQAQGANCILGACFTGFAPIAPPPATACLVGQVVCTSALQASGSNCILGSCYHG